MTFVHPNLSEHYGIAEDLAGLSDRVNDAAGHVELAAAFYDAASLPPVELRRVMRALARREGGASIDTAHELAVRRLRALLQLDAEEARIIARSFADAFIDLPGPWRDRSREIELAVIKNALHAREFLALTEMLPWLHEAESVPWLLEHLGSDLDQPTDAPAVATSALAPA